MDFIISEVTISDNGVAIDKKSILGYIHNQQNKAKAGNKTSRLQARRRESGKV